MDEKRMVGDYTVINSMYIGLKEIILGENPRAANGERYVCCYAERVLFYRGAPISAGISRLVLFPNMQAVSTVSTGSRIEASGQITISNRHQV